LWFLLEINELEINELEINELHAYLSPAGPNLQGLARPVSW
jgi:hypothetical protein